MSRPVWGAGRRMQKLFVWSVRGRRPGAATTPTDAGPTAGCGDKNHKIRTSDKSRADQYRLLSEVLEEVRRKDLMVCDLDDLLLLFLSLPCLCDLPRSCDLPCWDLLCWDLPCWDP